MKRCPFFSLTWFKVLLTLAYLPLMVRQNALADDGSSIPSDLKEPDAWVDVSKSIGIPLGNLGAGYSVFGKYGFVWVNFDGRPDTYGYESKVPGTKAYNEEPAKKSSYGFLLTEGDQTYVLQQTAAKWSSDAKTFDTVSSYAYLPKGVVKFSKADFDLSATVTAYTPLLPHDLAAATIPVQVFDVTIENHATEAKQASLQLVNSQAGEANGNAVVFKGPTGQLAFAADNGVADEKGVHVDVSVGAQGRQTYRFVIGWYYPTFNHTRPAKRYYTKAFPDALSVVKQGLQDADAWLKRIDDWHDSLQVPAYFKRLWFASLTSTMTSTMLSTEPFFFEIETPHACLNTMDVDVYSCWVYLVNWPEIERMDMDMYISVIPQDGPTKGLVWHSLWSDSADYVEEPTFLVRLYRDHLWFNDKEWTRKGFARAVDAANHVYQADHYKTLIESKAGRQSYDLWDMPGVSSYVNSAWIYGLYGLDKLSVSLNEPAQIADQPIADFRVKAAEDYDNLLWNESEKDWNCFFRTPGASKGGIADSTFTDQLFGKWVLAIDPGAEEVLPAEKVKTALHSLYVNNLVQDADPYFRGWSNGMLPGHKLDDSGFHSKVCWFGPQINLGSLLGLSGDEAASLDVVKSVEKSLRGNNLAVGEWNGEVNKDLHVSLAVEEPGKDTPRFPPYPRYKSGWEYLIRLLGLQMNEQTLFFKPYETLDFSLQSIELAGTKLSIKVEAGWTHALVNQNPVSLPVEIPRDGKDATIEFLK